MTLVSEEIWRVKVTNLLLLTLFVNFEPDDCISMKQFCSSMTISNLFYFYLELSHVWFLVQVFEFQSKCLHFTQSVRVLVHCVWVSVQVFGCQSKCLTLSPSVWLSVQVFESQSKCLSFSSSIWILVQVFEFPSKCLSYSPSIWILVQVFGF